MNTTELAAKLSGRLVDRDPEQITSVGGLSLRLAAWERQDIRPELAAVGKAIDLRRREKGVTSQELASRARVTVESLTEMERGLMMPNSPDIIRLVSKVLELPADKLLIAAGLTETSDATLRAAALRLVHQTKTPESLTPVEQAALTEFIDVLRV